MKKKPLQGGMQSATHPVKLIVGLGNPGARARETYHNVGFLALDHIGKTLGGQSFTDPRGKRFSYAKAHDSYLIKPHTFMNESGIAVKEALRYFRSTPDELLVIHDDFDIPLGKAKVSFARGAAGHHGVESVIEAIGTKKFWRMRIGLRSQNGKAGGRVLKRIPQQERKILYGVFGAVIVKRASKETPRGLFAIASSGKLIFSN